VKYFTLGLTIISSFLIGYLLSETTFSYIPEQKLIVGQNGINKIRTILSPSGTKWYDIVCETPK